MILVPTVLQLPLDLPFYTQLIYIHPLLLPRPTPPPPPPLIPRCAGTACYLFPSVPLFVTIPHGLIELPDMYSGGIDGGD